MFRTVREEKVDCVIGFRVQMRGRSGNWMNRGRRVFTKEGADALRMFFEAQHTAATVPITVTEV